jgi:quinol monooxygenase YgiN
MNKNLKRLFGKLRAEIRKHEPGGLLYSLLSSRTNSQSYIVQEQYRDELAWEAHQSSQYGKIHFPKIRAVLESIHVEYFEVAVA